MTEDASTAVEAESPTVRAEIVGRAGVITLDRPRAINALDLDMIRAVRAALEGWRDDPAVGLVILTGAGDRGFCAGGDVRTLRESVIRGEPEATADFFLDEYALNAAIAEYPKPVVALADGITMGGGIGLAGHAAIRVVTERSRLAMPETRIGFAPDVGGTWLLGRAPGRVGEYLGLTGATMNGADAVYAGFADHLVHSDRLAELVDVLTGVDEGADVAATVRSFADTDSGTDLMAEATLPDVQEWIDEDFCAEKVSEIVARLRGRAEPAASGTAQTLLELSPTALAVTLAAVRAARKLPDLRAALEQEYAVTMWFVHTQPDLSEGIRAQLVDKDRTPRWNPPSLNAVASDIGEQALGFEPARPLWG